MLSGIVAVGKEDQLRVCAFEQQDSALLSVFSATNVLIRLPMGVPAQPPGTLVDVLPLDGA
jgi:molybdopterin biosynthesis enzyme